MKKATVIPRRPKKPKVKKTVGIKKQPQARRKTSMQKTALPQKKVKRYPVFSLLVTALFIAVLIFTQIRSRHLRTFPAPVVPPALPPVAAKPTLKKSVTVKNKKPGTVPPTKLPSPVKKERVIYLTFDADMTPYMKRELDTKKVAQWYDPTVISYLKESNIPATIFTTGMFAEIYPNVIIDLGHNALFAVENHTYDHAAFTPGCYGLRTLHRTPEKIYEIEKTQTIIENLTGTAPRYVRLPGLCGTSVDTTLIEHLHLKRSDVGSASEDAFDTDTDKIVSTVLSSVKAGSNTIIMHLGGPNAPKTAEALQIFIPALIKDGYTFMHM